MTTDVALAKRKKMDSQTITYWLLLARLNHMYIKHESYLTTTTPSKAKHYSHTQVHKYKYLYDGKTFRYNR